MMRPQNKCLFEWLLGANNYECIAPGTAFQVIVDDPHRPPEPHWSCPDNRKKFLKDTYSSLVEKILKENKQMFLYRQQEDVITAAMHVLEETIDIVLKECSFQIESPTVEFDENSIFITYEFCHHGKIREIKIIVDEDGVEARTAEESDLGDSSMITLAKAFRWLKDESNQEKSHGNQSIEHHWSTPKKREKFLLDIYHSLIKQVAKCQGFLNSETVYKINEVMRFLQDFLYFLTEECAKKIDLLTLEFENGEFIITCAYENGYRRLSMAHPKMRSNGQINAFKWLTDGLS